MTNEKARQLLKECEIDPREKVEYPPVAISYGNKVLSTKAGNKVLKVPIGTYGNFSFIQAPPKSKKSFFVSLLASAYMASNHFSGEIRGNRDGKKLLHFDTEQANFHASIGFRRVIDMSGVSDNYHTFALRQLSYKDRIIAIEQALIDFENVGVLIIDGIADLVSDVNDLEQSNLCVQKLMEWTARFNCHIITVIHSNAGTSKPTGHLGSFLEKKTETQIELELNNVHKAWVTVSCKRSRGYPFEKFSFKVNEVGLPEVIGDIYDPLKDFNKDSTKA